MTVHHRHILIDAGLERAQQRLEYARAHATHGTLGRAELEVEAVRQVLDSVQLVLRVEQDRNQLELPWRRP